MKKVLFYFVVFLRFWRFDCFGTDRVRLIKIDRTRQQPVTTRARIFDAKYEGGMFGYSKKEEGTFKFDDVNERLVFFGKDNKEKFAIPYKSMLIIYPQSKSVQSTTGTVVSVDSLAGRGNCRNFIKEKRRYLIINFDDPDVDVKGMTNFKLENKELLDSVLIKRWAKKPNSNNAAMLIFVREVCPTQRTMINS